MTRLLRGALLASLFMVAGSGYAQVSDAVALSVMQETGLWKQLEGVSKQVAASMSTALTTNPGRAREPQESKRLVRAAEDAFATDRLRDVSKRVLSESLSTRDLPALRAWYHSPLGQRITQLEESAALDSREPDAASVEDASLLATLPAARRSLIAELSIVTRAAESTTDATIDTSVAIELAVQLAVEAAMEAGNDGARGAGLVGAQRDVPHRSERDMRAALNATRATMMQLNEKNAQGSFARTYQSLSDAEFAKYIAFARTPAGRRCNDLMTRALNAAMVEAGGNFGRSLAPIPDGART